MKNLSTTELFDIASQPKARTKKHDSNRVKATTILINRASFQSGQSFHRLLDAIEYLNNGK